jgi:type IV pilus assembly protein PilQ
VNNSSRAGNQKSEEIMRYGIMIKAVQRYFRVDRDQQSESCRMNKRLALTVQRACGFAALIFLSVLMMPQAFAAKHSLKDIVFNTLPGERLQLVLSFDTTPPEPLAFTIDNPARIALDFPDTKNLLARRSKDIGIGVARSVTTAEAKGRTRVVVNLSDLVSYKTTIAANDLIMTLGDRSNTLPAFESNNLALSAAVQSATRKGLDLAPRITNIDFRRGATGEGRIMIMLSDPKIQVDLSEQGGKILLDFFNTKLPKDLAQRLDVLDFATPVKTIDSFARGDNVRMVIEASGDYEHLAYQSDNLYTVEVREVPKIVQEKRKKEQYTGERLSLNFQDIEVRSVLQLIADFTGLNLVVSDTVSGNLTLRLKNVPWDQALDIVLKTRGLAMRRTGNVLLIAPSEEIAAREKLELEAQKQVQELAPLRSEFIQINYAKASDIAALLKAPENSLLSDRGAVSIDTRTNTLLVQDTSEKLAEIRNIVKRLDVPVRQVLIESRIVIAEDNFAKELGVRFGVNNFDPAKGGSGINSHGLSGNLNATTAFFNGDDIPVEDTLNVDLPVPDPAGSIGLALAKLPLGFLLELELSAAQAESRVEIVSTPRVITSNQTKARIERGTEIPYQEASSSGATSVSFKKAVLSLEVTPQVTPDDRIFMDLVVNNDNVGDVFNGIPSIDTRAIETQVLVDNGQTVVLGGIYDTSNVESNERVPFFSDIPILGRLFRTDALDIDNSELLIFITPKIIDEKLALTR